METFIITYRYNIQEQWNLLRNITDLKKSEDYYMHEHCIYHICVSLTQCIIPLWTPLFMFKMTMHHLYLRFIVTDTFERLPTNNYFPKVPNSISHSYS